MRCVRVDRNDIQNEIYEEAATRIASDLLVAFPTETVYGLGANGLSVKAVLAIFEMKKRPLDDPVILHVNSKEEASALWDLTPESAKLIEVLQNEFWPGPVTIIAPASKLVPSEVTANTGRVAIRCPSHPVARRLISAAKVPIAAPSANLFSRISPTHSKHVKKYFAEEDLLVLECDDCCDIGIESTVISITDCKIKILRSGAVTQDALRKLLQSSPYHLKIEVEAKEAFISTTRPPAAAAAADKCAPGQCLLHYAPLITTYLCIGGPPADQNLSRSAIVDMSGEFQTIGSTALYYKSLVVGEASIGSVARNLFSSLHDVEDCSGAEELLLCISKEDSLKPEYAGVLDRSLRAAAHKILQPGPSPSPSPSSPSLLFKNGNF